MATKSKADNNPTQTTTQPIANQEQTHTQPSANQDTTTSNVDANEHTTIENQTKIKQKTTAKPVVKYSNVWLKRQMTTSINAEYIGKINTLLPTMPDHAEINNVNNLLKALIDSYITAHAFSDAKEEELEAMEVELDLSETLNQNLRDEIKKLEHSLNELVQQPKTETVIVPPIPDAKPVEKTEKSFMQLLGF